MSHTENKIIVLWNILRITFCAIPIIAGLDKFTNLLVQWDQYLSPWMISALPLAPHTFMILVGLIEITAGFLVFFYTKIGSYIVMLWLISIASVLISGGMFDVAVRDVVMAIAAYVLAQMTDIKTEMAGN